MEKQENDPKELKLEAETIIQSKKIKTNKK